MILKISQNQTLVTNRIMKDCHFCAFWMNFGKNHHFWVRNGHFPHKHIRFGDFGDVLLELKNIWKITILKPQKSLSTCITKNLLPRCFFQNSERQRYLAIWLANNNHVTLKWPLKWFLNASIYLTIIVII